MALGYMKTTDKLENVWMAAVAAIKAFAEEVRSGEVTGPLSEVQEMLETLPLGTSEFSRASNNLGNAERYMRSQEWGAASYELRMLAGVLRNCAFANRRPYSEKRALRD